MVTSRIVDRKCIPLVLFSSNDNRFSQRHKAQDWTDGTFGKWSLPSTQFTLQRLSAFSQ
jgi:hypothetical protein